MKKNVASQSIGVEMITAADGTAFTGAVSALVTIDNGTQTAGGGAAPAHEGNGYHSYTPTQAETNGDHIAFTFTGTGAIPSTVQVYTAFPQSVDNAAGIADIPTVAEFNARTLAAADYFDPATDAVANVTLCATTTTNTDMRGTDSAALATALATVDTNVDAILVDTGTTIPAQITALNDVAATDIVSGGAINTTAGAVDNVTTVATTTTNTDMRGTDSAATAANLATVDANVDAILVDTGTTLPAQISALNDITVNDILTTQMTEAYAADGVAPTLAQALFLVQQTIGDFSIAGTTITTKKLDGTTTAATYTLDDGTNPTSRTRAT
jgi:hypothetical protein